MKITKHGLTVKPMTVHFSCSHCGCEWIGEGDEFKMTNKEVSIFKKKWVEYTMNCPECKREASMYSTILEPFDL